MGNTIILLSKDPGHGQYYCIIDVNGSRIYSAEMWCSSALVMLRLMAGRVS